MIFTDTITIDLQAYYSRCFYVRRRRLAGKVFLVYLSRIFEIDELSNSIWLHCDGTKNALQIAQVISGAFPNVDKGKIGLITLYNLQFFLDKELVVASSLRVEEP